VEVLNSVEVLNLMAALCHLVEVLSHCPVEVLNPEVVLSPEVEALSPEEVVLSPEVVVLSPEVVGLCRCPVEVLYYLEEVLCRHPVGLYYRVSLS
jgi:hypothetical protein